MQSPFTTPPPIGPSGPFADTDLVRAAEAASMTLAEVVAFLRSDETTIRRATRSGKMPPPKRFGKRLLWPRWEIESWFEAGMPDAATWADLRGRYAPRKRAGRG